MPDALSAATLFISRLRDWLRICWLAYPEARPTQLTDLQEQLVPHKVTTLQTI